MASIFDLFVAINGDSSSYRKSMQEAGDSADSFAKRWESLDKKLAVSAGFAAIGAAAFAAATKFEDAGVRIQRSTGATGDKLEALEASFANVYKQTSRGSEQVSEALSLLSARTGATGKDLEALTLASLKLTNVHKEDASVVIPALTQMFGAWSIAVSKQAAAINYLRIVSQQTGAPVAKLTEEVAAQAPVLRALGYGWEQSVALIASFEKTGVPTEKVIAGMSVVLKQFAKDGVLDTTVAWKDLVSKVQSGAVTFDDFLKKYGGKSGAYLFEAMRDGKTDTDALSKSFAELQTKGVDAAKTLDEKYKTWLHSVEALTAAHKDLIVAVGFGWPAVSGLLSGIAKLAGPAVTAIGGIGGAISALLGPVLVVGAGIGGWFAGDAIQKKFGRATGINTGGLAAINERAGTTPKIGSSIINFLTDKPVGPVPAPKPKYGGGLTPTDTEWELVDHYGKALKVVSDQEALYYARENQLQAGHSATIADIAKTGETIKQYFSGNMIEASAAVAKFGEKAGENIPETKGLYESLGKELDFTGKEFDRLAKAADAATTEMLASTSFGKMAAAAEYFGITTTAQFDKISKESVAAFDIMRASGLATEHDLAVAALMTAKAEINADFAHGKITEEVYRKQSAELDADLAKWKGTLNEKETAIEKWARQTKAVVGTVSASLTQLSKLGGEAFNHLAQGMGANIADAIIYQKSIGGAMQAALASVLQSLAAQAIGYAIYATALGFLRLAQWDFVGAGNAFTSAAIWGAVGAVTAGIGSLVAPKQEKTASAAGGWESVPFDNAPALLHKNEMVLPADIAVPMRRMVRESPMGVGGISIHVGTMNGVARETVSLIANQIIRQSRFAGARI